MDHNQAHSDSGSPQHSSQEDPQLRQRTSRSGEASVASNQTSSSSQDGSTSTPVTGDEPPAYTSRNSRRARVDNDEDEDEQRRTNRQRMHPPLLDHSDSSNDHHYHPDVHNHAQQHREQQQAGGAPPQRPPMPFNRISFTVDILPTMGTNSAAPPPPGPNPQQPGPGRAVPPVFFELRFPFTPFSPTPDGAPGDAPHTHGGPNGNEDFNAFFQSLRDRMGNMPWVPFNGFNTEEPDDPGRAKRLLRGLEQVPEGLVKRMERVGMVEGEQVVCAICFDSLLNPEPADSAGEKMDVEMEGSPLSSSSSTPSDSHETVPDAEKKADEALNGKIVVLPCAHVFHASCLRPWFTRPHRTTCPTCRFDIDPESLTYAPPTRRSRPLATTAQPAGQAQALAAADAHPFVHPHPYVHPHTHAHPHPHPQPQAAEPAAFTPNETQNAAPRPQSQAGAGAPPRPPGAGRDMPYIIFDVSMLLPVQPSPHPQGQDTQPQQQQPQAPASGPPPPPPPVTAPNSQPAAPVSQPRIVHMDRNQLEQLILGRPISQPNQPPAQNGNQSQPQPQPAPAPQPQPQPAQSQPRAQVGPRGFWQPFPLGTSPFGVHGGAPQQTNAGPGGGLGNLFANMFGFGRGQQNNGADAQPQQTQPAPQPHAQAQAQAQAQPAPVPVPQAQPAPAAAPHAQQHRHDHPPLPSFEEFMRLVGLGPQPQQGQPQQQAQQPPEQQAQQPPQPPTAAGAQPHLPHTHMPFHPQDGLFMDGMRDLATSVLEQIFPAGVFVPIPPRPAPHGAAHPHPPPPPPGPIPFTVPNRPRAQQPPQEKRQWTLPAPPGPTLRERVERKERELGLRCSDISCGLAPTDEDPLPVIDPQTIHRIALRSPKDQEHVCEHAFHPACLVSAERVAGWSGADQKREVGGGEEEVQVSCPSCRAVGVISREDWDEGACALA